APQLAPATVTPQLDEARAELDPEGEPAKAEEHEDRRGDGGVAQEHRQEARLEQQRFPAEAVEAAADVHDRLVAGPEHEPGEDRHGQWRRLRQPDDEGCGDRDPERAQRPEPGVRVADPAEDRGRVAEPEPGAEQPWRGFQAALAAERRELLP